MVVDVMPTDAQVLGFSNRWYPAALATAELRRAVDRDVRLVTPVFFLATKLEAYRGRGGGDVSASHDLEDIVTVVDGRPEIVEEVAGAALDVRAYIAGEIQALVANPDFTDALPGFLLPDAASQARRSLLESRLRALCQRR
jgi:hypothetical protein